MSLEISFTIPIMLMHRKLLTLCTNDSITGYPECSKELRLQVSEPWTSCLAIWSFAERCWQLKGFLLRHRLARSRSLTWLGVNAALTHMRMTSRRGLKAQRSTRACLLSRSASGRVLLHACILHKPNPGEKWFWQQLFTLSGPVN